MRYGQQMIFEKFQRGDPYEKKIFFLSFAIKMIDYDEKTTNINFLSDFNLPRLYFKGSMSQNALKQAFFAVFKGY